jgi:hypothetical protein
VGVLLLAAGFGLVVAVGASAQAKAPAKAPAAKARPAAAEAPKDDDCLACHADKELKRGKAAAGRAASVHVDPAVLKGSTHAALECVSCHTTATAPHDERLPAVRCSTCHDQPKAALTGGVHGARPGRDRGGEPPCASCHGTHGVQRAASLGLDTCATCHPREVQLYRGSVHGRSRQSGGTDAAICASCHGATHTVLAKSDPRSPVYHLNLPRTCANCHADPELARRHNIPVGNVYQLYMDSIHGRAVTRSGLLVSANCSDCHGAHDIQPRSEPTSRVFRANVPRTCGTCHAGVLSAYSQSVHGRAVASGSAAAPVCIDCHSAHQIRRVEGEPWQLDAIRECGTCHEESLKTYRDTFHGKVTTLGFTRVAKCADCHGSHTIRPASDQASKVSETNIVATCRQCHPQATWQFTRFHPHADPHDRARFPLLYWTYVLMTGLLVFTFAFFGLHTLLWLPRSLVERLRRQRGHHEERSP